METTTIPPVEEWGDVLADNRVRAERLHTLLGASRVNALREEALAIAQEYTEELRELAAKVGVALSALSSTEMKQPLIMAGHQPVVYHSGILFKTLQLAALARRVGGVGVNLVVDTDEGDAGRIAWPRVHGDSITLADRSFAVGGVLYQDQKVAAASDAATLFDEVTQDLVSSGLTQAAEGARRAGDLYAALAGESIAKANAIVRAQYDGMPYLELPLSRLVGAPRFREFLLEIVDGSERFVELYNATLDAYRSEHKIKNPANPFPNMRRDEQGDELPLWERKEGARYPVVRRSGDDRMSYRDRVITPRGSVVTLVMRGCCADLFIHGLGGGKYDQFVDQFGERYWGAPLPRFVVASATRHLFPERIRQLSEARELKKSFKEIISHTERFFGRGLFTPEEENELHTLTDKRRELLTDLQGASNAEQRSIAAHGLNALNRQIRNHLEHGSLAPRLAEGSVNDAVFARWSYREFPFFLFPSTAA